MSVFAYIATVTRTSACYLAAITDCAAFNWYVQFLLHLCLQTAKDLFFSSSFSPITLHLYPRYELLTAGCSSGVPCSLKLLSLVLKLSYFSPSCMLFV